MESTKRSITYLGNRKPLEEIVDAQELSEEALLLAVIKFYERSSKQVAKERTSIYQKQLKVKPKSVKIVKINSRWGSCNTQKEITYHYLLAALPMELIDYVVVHELCHLYHMNHDRSFWRKIGSIIPDYKRKAAMLFSVIIAVSDVTDYSI